MRNEITKLLTGSAVVVFVIAGGCSKQKTESPGSSMPEPSPGAQVARVNKQGDEIMASSSKAEARQWMKQPSHIFFRADAKTVGQFVEEFYGAGATQVLIGDIKESEGKQYGAALLVVLPQDASVRAKLFEIGSRADAAFHTDTVSDNEQRYVYFSLH